MSAPAPQNAAQAPVTKALVELEGIHLSFGDNQVLKGIDLTVNKGDAVSIIGPSGSGKSTILRCINGLLIPQSGKITVGGTRVDQLKTEAERIALRKRIGIVFQQFNLFPHLTVMENITIAPIKILGTPKAEAERHARELLEKVRLSQKVDAYPGQLSGGQQQRVAIARAVVNRPKVLLLDESLSALDYKLRKQMQNELKALQRKLGITFIFVTHDQEEALTMSDRIVVMREGQIEQDGTPREIYEEPRNLFVARFIGEINVFSAEVLHTLDNQRVRARVEGRECDILVPFTVQPGQRLNVLLRPEDLRVEEINDGNNIDGLIGYVRERNYKGMTLESTVELENGKLVTVSEFFNEDDPDFDHSLNQKMAVNWVESWEVVLKDENDA